MSVVSYGGGTNSTAMLVGLWEQGERPDLILFADTGGEKPHTYEHLRVVNEWCKAKGFPEIVTVRHRDSQGRELTLEDRCLENNMLPSIAYGFKACSDKHKRRPQDRFVNNWPPAQGTWLAGDVVVKLIGFDADEPHRAKIANDAKYAYRYPLIEWDWGREECVEAIARAGLPQPGKSACFFCPSSKKAEILGLAVRYPALLERAVRMEKNAKLTTIKGLGRRFAWGEFIAAQNKAAEVFCDAGNSPPCDCYDGGERE